MMAGGVIGAGIGDGMAGAQLAPGVARQPQAQQRMSAPFLITVGPRRSSILHQRRLHGLLHLHHTR